MDRLLIGEYIMIKCNVSKCFNNKNGMCLLKNIELMMNNDNVHSLECLDCETQDDVELYNKLKQLVKERY